MLTAEAIKAQARALGFDLCGIAPVDDFPELRSLRDWLDRGYAADMHWMARTADCRADVRAVLPSARSVIVTGTLYNTCKEERSDAAVRRGGRSGPPDAVATIARYAWGDDYHIVLQRRLEALIDWMRDQSPEPFDARAYVDSGPVQERVYAQYAGLGWIGKNSCLINAELGSFVFLSEIICTLPLDPDPQGLEQCGSCTRCLEACPTGALVEPGTLDSNRCISYLTIERRGSIPAELRPAVGTHVYGCDICQTVCPYNGAAPESADRAWLPRAGLDLPRLVDLWRQSDEDVQALTRGSAMRRAKLTGLRRNLAVAIGNCGDPEAVASLAVPFADRASVDDPMVQEHVDWALTRNFQR
jgi:epoxyqueuosine reductase